jgi:carbonic anhydrase/acetyltransferase-like protein (isoleucine patch superfamily)
MTTRATEWLDEHPEDIAKLEELLADLGLPYQVYTELPTWMKKNIVSKLKESFQQDYWAKISEATAGDVERWLLAGLQEGASIREMAQQMAYSFMEETGKYAMRRAENIARTESGNALNGARKGVMDQLQADLGDRVPMRAAWLSVLGNTTRDSHAHLDGVPADKNGMWNLSGYQIPWPGHFSLPASERCNCQCSIVNEIGMLDAEAAQLISEYGERLEAGASREELRLKFNPYHDSLGRFSTGGGVGGMAPDTGGSGGGSSSASGKFNFGRGLVKAKRHTNPDGSVGGWVADTAEVAKTVHVGENAQVYDRAKVLGQARLLDKAEVFEDAIVSDNAEISGHADIRGDARVWDQAKVSGYAYVHGDAKVSGHALVADNTTVHGNAVVSGNAVVGGDVTISGNAKVSGDAKVYGNAKVSGDAKVSGHAEVQDFAQVEGNADVSGDMKVGGFSRLFSDDPGAIKLDVYRGSLSLGAHVRSEYPKKVKQHIAATIGEKIKTQVTTEEISEFGRDVPVDRLGSHELVAAAFVDSWATTSGDHNPKAVAIQKQAGELFKLSKAADPELAYGMEDKASVASFRNKHSKVINANLKAQYEHTQETLKSLGIEEITLYRGTTQKLKGSEIQTNPLTSFSTNPAIAKDFANSEDEDGVIVKVKAPAKQVFSTSVTGNGCYNEDEVVLLGGTFKFERVWND